MSNDSPITLTDGLVKRVVQLRESDGDPNLMLRIFISGGGCSGFQYGFEFARAVEDSDLVFERDGAQIVIDDISLQYLDGATIDFVEDLGGSYFRIDNPNARSSCGCGTSFSV